MTTNDSDNNNSSFSIERFIDSGLSERAAKTAMVIAQTFSSTDIMLMDVLKDTDIIEIAEFYDDDEVRAVRAASLIGSVALKEVYSTFEEVEYINDLILKLESASLGHIAEEEDVMTEFAAELGIDLGMGREYGLRELLDKIKTMKVIELIHVAKRIGIYSTDEALSESEDEEADDYKVFGDEDSGSVFDSEFDSDDEYTEESDFSGEYDELEEDNDICDIDEDEAEDQPSVLIDEGEEWIVE